MRGLAGQTVCLQRCAAVGGGVDALAHLLGNLTHTVLRGHVREPSVRRERLQVAVHVLADAHHDHAGAAQFDVALACSSGLVAVGAVGDEQHHALDVAGIVHVVQQSEGGTARSDPVIQVRASAGVDLLQLALQRGLCLCVRRHEAVCARIQGLDHGIEREHVHQVVLVECVDCVHGNTDAGLHVRVAHAARAVEKDGQGTALAHACDGLRVRADDNLHGAH